MKKEIKPSLIIVIVFAIVSCTQELDLPFPQGEEQLVLNSILHPDSIIKISLTRTLPLETTNRVFPVVDNAKIRLYEDDVLAGMPAYQDNIYVLEFLPKEGKEYRIEVEVPGFAILKASDVVPERPVAEICLRDDPILRDAIDIKIVDQTDMANTYWLGGILLNSPFCSPPEEGKTCNVIQPFFESFSSIPDRFNADIDNVAGGISLFSYYMRIEDTAISGDQIELVVRSFFFLDQPLPIGTYRLDIKSASQHYDRYLKSSINHLMSLGNYADEDFEINPFAEIVQTYSNVENGTGIFAAYNSTTFEVGDHPCE